MKNRQKYIQIFTTTTKKNDAYKIAKTLVNKKLSACVQITGPIESVYRWHGKIEKSREFLCIIKTKMSNYKKVEKEIKIIHPYELPEIIALPIIEGSQEYLEWINKEL
ncbi:MAG: divalent-cation tolerance protein CutA [Patescibacteria group bacterium]